MKDMARHHREMRGTGAGGHPAAQIDRRRKPASISDLTAQISPLEGSADEMHDKGLHDSLRALRRNGPDGFFVGNEVYDHLEKVVDRFEDVANVMHGIVIEHV